MIGKVWLGCAGWGGTGHIRNNEARDRQGEGVAGLGGVTISIHSIVEKTWG